VGTELVFLYIIGVSFTHSACIWCAIYANYPNHQIRNALNAVREQKKIENNLISTRWIWCGGKRPSNQWRDHVGQSRPTATHNRRDLIEIFNVINNMMTQMSVGVVPCLSHRPWDRDPASWWLPHSASRHKTASDANIDSTALRTVVVNCSRNETENDHLRPSRPPLLLLCEI